MLIIFTNQLITTLRILWFCHRSSSSLNWVLGGVAGMNEADAVMLAMLRIMGCGALLFEILYILYGWLPGGLVRSFVRSSIDATKVCMYCHWRKRHL
jgi:hypothetical protein